MLYPYEEMIGLDPYTRDVAPGAGQVYALADLGFSTPLPTVDVNGLPVELTVDPETGFLPSFNVEGHTEVRFKSGDFTKVLVTTRAIPGGPGDPGPAGPPPEMISGTTTTVDPEYVAFARVVPAGEGKYRINMDIPRGAKGDPGDRGLPGLEAMPQAEGMAEHISTPGPVQTALNAQSVGRTGQQNLDGTAKLHFNGGFTPNYDTVLWIASQQRLNPELNSQGMYIQHRVAGDLHNKVHDAVASELRLNGVTNTGAGQSAHENTLVVGGTGNDINLACVTLSTFHPDSTATGTIQEINMFRANQVLPAPGLTVDKAVSGFFAAQTVGTENYAIWANGDSAFSRLVPQSPSSIAVDIRTRAGQTADLLAVNTDAKIFSVSAAGTAHFGVADTGSWVSVHNRDAAKAALRVKAHGSQAAKVLDVTDSSGTSWVYVANNGDLRTVNRSVALRSANDGATMFALTPAGPRWQDVSLTRQNAGSTGSASPLPSTPKGYFKALAPDGTEALIPYYPAP